jgi:hypothetical protein
MIQLSVGHAFLGARTGNEVTPKNQIGTGVAT